MRNDPRCHRLPNGKTTRSMDRYIREWRKLANRWTKLTGHHHYAYDPDIAFIDAKIK